MEERSLGSSQIESPFRKINHMSMHTNRTMGSKISDHEEWAGPIQFKKINTGGSKVHTPRSCMTPN